METGKKEGLKADVMEIVLQEFAQDLQANTQAVGDLVTAANGINGKLDEIKAVIGKSAAGNAAAISLPAHVLAKLESISKGVTDTMRLIAERPQPIIHKKQFLLFPEGDTGRYYKVIFGRWLLLLVILFFLGCLYRWAIHYSDNQKEIRLEQLQNDHIGKSWDYLYHNNGREVKRLMDKAYTRTGQRDSQ